MKILEDKSSLRRQLIQWRRGIDPRDRCLWDCDATMALLHLPQYAAADTLLCYLSSPEEFSTAALVAHAVAMGKRVGVPRWGNGEMVFCAFTDYRGLRRDKMGLLQPTATMAVLEDLDNAFCVVPALAADCRGYRLGYGGGYYDRFLERFLGFSVTPIYDHLLLDNLCTEPHDRPVDCVVTPTRQLHIKTKGENL